MRKQLFVTLVVMLCFAAVAVAQNQSILGTWKMDAAKSSFGSQPAPKSATLVIMDDKDNSLKWKYTAVGADGKPMTSSYSGAFDGKQHPVTDSSKTYKSAAFTRNSSGDVDITWTKTDGSTEKETSTVQGNTMTNKNGDVTVVMERAGKSGAAKSGKAAPKSKM